MIPYFIDPVTAGFPSPAENEIDQTLDLNELLIQHPTATFFVRVQGSSMQGAGIHDGDILIVDRALTPHDGSIVIAIINGEFTVKRLSCKGKELFLLPENPDFPPLKIEEAEGLHVWGVVTYAIHKLCTRS
jgi:DNA polymerase V